jgi:Arc/MetJ family transcription regulator
MYIDNISVPPLFQNRHCSKRCAHKGDYVLFYVYEEVYMRTNVELDDDLLKKAFRYSKARTKKGLLHEALQELIAAREKLDLRDLRGKITFRDDYDYKKLRKGV